MGPDNDDDKKEEVRSMLGDRAAELVDESGGNAAASGSTDAERSVRDDED